MKFWACVGGEDGGRFCGVADRTTIFTVGIIASFWIAVGAWVWSKGDADNATISKKELARLQDFQTLMDASKLEAEAILALKYDVPVEVVRRIWDDSPSFDLTKMQSLSADLGIPVQKMAALDCDCWMWQAWRRVVSSSNE